MAEILTFDNQPEKESRGNPIKDIFEFFQSLDKFTKSFLTLGFLILLVIPFSLKNYFQTRQEASSQTSVPKSLEEYLSELSPTPSPSPTPTP